MKNIMDENIDERIERVTRSVASKKKDIESWQREAEKKKKNSKRSLLIGVSAAASVAILAGVGIHYITITEDSPQNDEPITYEYGAKQSSMIFRGGSDDSESIIEKMIELEEYDEALKGIEAFMGDTVIDSSLPQERQEYIRTLQELRAYKLEWLKIQTLLKLKRNDEAVELLQIYSLKDGENQKEAQELLKELKK